MDAGFGAVVAIQDMLLHTRRGVHHAFAGAPTGWRDCAFNDMLTEGGFLVSAERAGGHTSRITIKAQRAWVFRLANPWTGDVDAIELAAGETRVLEQGAHCVIH